MKVVNLTDFPLNQHHISLLQKGLSFSPTATMSEFEVFKDVSLFLRKVIFRYWHSDRGDQSAEMDEQSKEERDSLEALIALLEENQEFDSDAEPPNVSQTCPRPSKLSIKSLKMPSLSKHKRIHFFLEQVKKDLSRINWDYRGQDNLTKKERKALKELEEAEVAILFSCLRLCMRTKIKKKKYSAINIEQEVLRA